MLNNPESKSLEPAEVVRQFISDMHAWEVQSGADYQTSPPEDHQAFHGRLLATQAIVFARWCTPKERPYGRKGSFGLLPEYQPAHERILETCLENARRAVVHTQEGTGTKRRLQYVLLKKAGRWLIDSKKSLQFDGRWANRSL